LFAAFFVGGFKAIVVVDDFIDAAVGGSKENSTIAGILRYGHIRPNGNAGQMVVRKRSIPDAGNGIGDRPAPVADAFAWVMSTAASPLMTVLSDAIDTV
jgi:hypothetical protein